jgi:hypothetical protein
MLDIACCVFLIVLLSAFLIGATVCAIPAVLALLLCGNSLEKEKISGGEAVTIAVENIDYLMNGLIKSYEPANINYNYKNNAIAKPESKPYIDFNTKWNDFIIQIFKSESANYDFIKNDNVYYSSSSTEKSRIKDKKLIKQYQKVRELINGYPTSNYVPFALFNGTQIKKIEYQPKDKNKYEELMQKLLSVLILVYIRGKLTQEEEESANKLVDDFAACKYTTKNVKLTFWDNTEKNMEGCDVEKSGITYKGDYKKLHWGQRKLLLSEIDFFNRVATDMGSDKFKKQVISVCYPGSAHGNHLMILMELYPNIIFYLWDPARYNNVLYLVEFMRRNIPIKWSYKNHEKELAKKYEGRVFINMELTNDEFIEYHSNSSKGNFAENYKNNWGFFTDTSIKYFHEFRTTKQDTSPTLIISDIRLYAYQKIIGFFQSNNLELNNLQAVKYINSKLAITDYNRDMKLQEDWFLNTNSSYGLLKFKLKSSREFEINLQKKYLDGEIILQTWAPVSSTETRLFVKPKREPVAYYNIYGYEKSLRFFNSELRLSDMRKVKLSSLKIKVQDAGVTIGDIWKPFLPSDKICMDAVLETYMLYDYLKLYKDPKTIKSTDIMLMISDITQTLINMTNHQRILSYFEDQVNPKKILEYRSNIHKSFNNRLDYSSARNDTLICKLI